MSPEADTPQDIKPLESALASLTPAALHLDRDRLMYQAGQASVQCGQSFADMSPSPGTPGEGWDEGLAAILDERCPLPPLPLPNPLPEYRERGLTVNHRQRAWVWPAATAGMSTVAAALLVLLVARPEPRVIERVVYAPAGSSRTVAGDALANAAEPPQPQQSSRRPLVSVDARGALAGGLMGLATPSRRPEYLRLRDQVLAFGVDTWQKPAAGGATQPSQPASYRDAIDSLLNLEPSSDAQPVPFDSTESPDVGVQL